MYAVHLNNPTVAGLLEQYRCLPPSYIHTLSHSPFYYISTFSRIGNLSASDAAAQAEELAASDNPFAGNPLHNFCQEYDSFVAGDPKRHPALVVNAATPYNAETPLDLITESFITPADLFYVRNHLPVPIVDPKTWELEVIRFSCIC